MTIDKAHQPNWGAVTLLRGQLLDFNDLSLDMQLAVYEVWRDHGYDAARVFCQGA